MRNNLFLMSKVSTSGIRLDSLIGDSDERKLKIARRGATPNAYSGEAESYRTSTESVGDCDVP
jgi:hypothetical protein